MIATSSQLELFRKYLDLAPNVNSDLLQMCLDAAFTACKKYTGGIQLWADDDDVVVSTQKEGGYIYIPPSLPILSITTLKINDTTIDISTAYNSLGYYISGNIIKLRGYSFSGWIELTYKAGYEEDQTPPDLLLACFEYAAGLYEMKNTIRINSRTIKDENVNFSASALTANVKDIWNNYKVMRYD